MRSCMDVGSLVLTTCTPRGGVTMQKASSDLHPQRPCCTSTLPESKAELTNSPMSLSCLQVFAGAAVRDTAAQLPDKGLYQA